MRDGVLTRALSCMRASGLSLDDANNPEREEDFLRAPGIGRKALARLREYAISPADEPRRGGVRPGAGRKAADGATGVVQICITIRPDQRQLLAKLGGSPWVRSAIDAASKDVDK